MKNKKISKIFAICLFHRVGCPFYSDKGNDYCQNKQKKCSYKCWFLWIEKGMPTTENWKRDLVDEIELLEG